MEIPGWRTVDRIQNSADSGVLSVMQFFTILITLDLGKVAAIQFDIDTKCNDCPDTRYCLQNLCGVDQSLCDGNVTSTSSCDLKVRLID